MKPTNEVIDLNLDHTTSEREKFKIKHVETEKGHKSERAKKRTSCGRVILHRINP